METKKSIYLLFPTLEKKEWKKVDLNYEFAKYNFLDMKNINDQNKLLEIVSLNNKYYTYGGFGEDRHEIWSRLHEFDKMIHLGVDFNNLPIGLDVASISNGIIIHIMHDCSEHSGWGTRVIIYDESSKKYYLYGHLNELNVKLNDHIKIGTIIGKLGSYKYNGGWFTHLHLQLMNDDFMSSYSMKEMIDGYDYDDDINKISGILNPLDELDFNLL